MRRTSKERYLKPFVVLVAAAALGIIAFSVPRLGASYLDVKFLVLFVFTVLIGARLIIHIPSIKGELTVSDTLIFLTMLLWGGEPAILLAAAAGFFSSLLATRKITVHVFNLGVIPRSAFLTCF